jgi:hypothetical protein
MVSFLSPYANQDALTIAHDLDHKIVKLLNDAGGGMKHPPPNEQRR